MSPVTTKRRLANCFIAASSAGLLLAGCAADLDGQDEDPEEVLSITTGPKGVTLKDLGFTFAQLGPMGTPTYLSGRIPAAVRDGDDLRALFAGTLAEAFRLAPGTDFRVLSDRTDGRGYRYIRLQQLHSRVPVSGGEVAVQVDEGGSVVAVLGQLVPDLRMSMNPGMGGEEAVQRALQPLARSRITLHERPALHVYSEGRAAVLTWRTVAEYLGEKGRALETVYVGADDGRIVARHTHIHTGLTREVYDLRSACLRTGSELPGTLVIREGGSSSDNIATTVYDNTGTTYWFYKHFLGRDSYDNGGALLKSSVHVKFSTGFSCSGENAAWLGAPYNQMVYGDGDGGATFKPLTSLDVTAHELTHAVTNFSSNLTYQNESGALNEAISDILGAAAEAWKESGGGQGGNPGTFRASANTWKIGEEVAGPGLPGGALRFMNNPTADNYSKDYYPERLTGPSDNGGVHGNSGIANLAFYLMSQGGRHPRNRTMVQVPAIGIDKATRIFYLANNTLFTASTNFQGARNATAQAARTLFGDCSAEWTATQKAWDAVGVPGTWTPCGGGGDDTTAPQVTLSAPAGNLSGTVTLTANASDNVAVTAVEFYRGTALIGTDNTAPYSITWDTTAVPNGSHTLTAKARDAAGNVGTSAAVTVTVSNMGGGGGGKREAEPNDRASQANVISAPGTEIEGFISSSSDVDVFRMELAPGKTLTATLTPPSGADFDLYVYNSNLVLIGLSERSAGLVDQVSVTNRGTSTFTRYIVVRHYSGASATRSYKLRAAW